MTHRRKVYYFKLKLVELTDHWVAVSLIDSVRTARQTNHALVSDRYVLLKFKEGSIPPCLYKLEAGNEMKQEEALAEVGGNDWQ